MASDSVRLRGRVVTRLLEIVTNAHLRPKQLFVTRPQSFFESVMSSPTGIDPEGFFMRGNVKVGTQKRSNSCLTGTPP
jgi:hypothetical protein